MKFSEGRGEQLLPSQAHDLSSLIFHTASGQKLNDDDTAELESQFSKLVCTILIPPCIAFTLVYQSGTLVLLRYIWIQL